MRLLNILILLCVMFSLGGGWRWRRGMYFSLRCWGVGGIFLRYNWWGWRRWLLSFYGRLFNYLFRRLLLLLLFMLWRRWRWWYIFSFWIFYERFNLLRWGRNFFLRFFILYLMIWLPLFFDLRGRRRRWNIQILF